MTRLMSCESAKVEQPVQAGEQALAELDSTVIVKDWIPQSFVVKDWTLRSL